MILLWMFKIINKMSKKNRPTKKFVINLLAIAIFVYVIGSILGCTISFQ